MRTVVCGIAFKERFSIEGEGVFMRRLFSCCASLALAIGGFGQGAPARLTKIGNGLRCVPPTVSPPRTGPPRLPPARCPATHRPPEMGGAANRGQDAPPGP